MSQARPVYVVGDVHGQYQKLAALLRGAGITDDALAWQAGPARLWLLGDLIDRGPDGIAVIDLAMRLQAEAAAAGGEAGVLLGNHEAMLLAAARLGERTSPVAGASFVDLWLRNGGHPDDLAALTDEHERWLADLPAMAVAAERLLIHADTLAYLSWGGSLAEVNATVRAILAGSHVPAWEQLIVGLSGRLAFHPELGGVPEACRLLLRMYGGRQVIHGHTPLPLLLQCRPDEVTGPLVYAGGLAVNVDGGMYVGGSGFVVRLDQLPLPSPPPRA